VDERRALSVFTGADEAAAGRAFERLRELALPTLRAYLRRTSTPHQEWDDILQDAFTKLWRSRPRLRDQGPAAWYALLKRTTDQCRIDRFRARRGDLPTETIEEVPDSDLPVVEALVGTSPEEAPELWRCADLLWLGLDPAVSEETHTRQLLAAQLFYLEGEPWPGVLRLLGPGSPGEPPLTRERLDDWLAQRGVLLLLFYESLHYSNDRLAAVLVGLDEETRPGELDRLMRRATEANPETPPGGWNWEEVRALVWRYRNALLMEQIVSRNDCALSRAELEALFDRTRARLPFVPVMERLCRALESAGVELPVVLAAPGLWQRLAFQYCYADGLPHRDIHERTAAAAELGGYSLTLGMLNVWLSNGRLIARLARYWAAARGENEP
jgi:DNA-directed RNA polymerase specialized sigma24 family protein